MGDCEREVAAAAVAAGVWEAVALAAAAPFLSVDIVSAGIIVCSTTSALFRLLSFLVAGREAAARVFWRGWEHSRSSAGCEQSWSHRVGDGASWSLGILLSLGYGKKRYDRPK